MSDEQQPIQPPDRIDIAKAFSESPPSLDFVLPGMLAGTVGALVSPGGAGKSMMALQLSTLVAGGADLVGLDAELKTGRVLYLAAEDPQTALQHRLHALGVHLSPELRDRVAGDVELIPLLGHGFDVMDEQWYSWLMDRACDTRLVICDTLRRIHRLDENSSGDMAVLLDRLEMVTRVTGCTMLFLHHSSKAAALQGQGDMQQASRGSSVLVDNIRWQSFMAGMTADEAEKFGVGAEERGMFVRWGVSKQNYGKPIAEVWLRRAEGGVLVPANLIARGKRAKGAFDE